MTAVGRLLTLVDIYNNNGGNIDDKATPKKNWSICYFSDVFLSMDFMHEKVEQVTIFFLHGMPIVLCEHKYFNRSAGIKRIKK